MYNLDVVAEEVLLRAMPSSFLLPQVAQHVLPGAPMAAAAPRAATAAQGCARAACVCNPPPVATGWVAWGLIMGVWCGRGQGPHRQRAGALAHTVTMLCLFCNGGLYGEGRGGGV
jgi:hypothetical protein